jgi:hypothetical protein
VPAQCTPAIPCPPVAHARLVLEKTNDSASNRSAPFLRWTVGSAKPKKGKTDGAVITVNIAKLDPINGGTVCVDLSGDCWRLGASLT